MNSPMLAERPTTVKHTPRFVPALSEYDQGRQLYRRGKPLSECVTDEMSAGWLDAECAGFMAYSRHMEREGVPAAVAFSVNWTGEAW